MSNWKQWPDELNHEFAGCEHPDRIIYPDLNDGSPLVLACDHSGEHAAPEFRVLSFLLTTYKSLDVWEPLRSAVRKKHLSDGRRMSFKGLSDALRIRAFPSFLDAASHLNGVLLCVAVEKGFSFPKDGLHTWRHTWTPDTLNKLVEVCVFGGVIVDGLRSCGQSVHWITDDDSTVSTDAARDDAATLMGGVIHKYADNEFDLAVGIASQFADDDRAAEDLVAVPDLAAGAFSETLTTMGKSNMPTSGSGPDGVALLVQIKSSLINAWRYDNSKPLKHMNAVVRSAEGGGMRVSFCSPFVRLLRPDESAVGAPTLNSKWRRAIEADLRARGIDPVEMLKSIGIDDLPC